MAQYLINKYVWLVETIYKAKEFTFKELKEEWSVNHDMNEDLDLSLRTFHNWCNACEYFFALTSNANA